MATETVTLADGSTREDLLVFATDDPAEEPIVRVDDFAAKTGFTTIEAAVTGGTEVLGTKTKDFWQGSDGISNVFTDHTAAAVTDIGDNNHDILIGGNQADTIDAGDGWDYVRGHDGNDAIEGGRGDDLLFGDGGNDVIDGDYVTDPGLTGTYVIQGADTNDGSKRTWFGVKPAEPEVSTSPHPHIRQLAGDDEIYGGDGADIIRGNGGSDRLSGDAGNDTLQGGEGDDYLLGGAGADSIDGGAGFDAVSFEDEAAAVTVNLATGTTSTGDTLTSIEDVVGTDFGDTITGNAGDNIVDAGLGNDTIDGGAGTDSLSFFGSDVGVEVDLETTNNSTGTATRERKDENGDPVIETDALSNIENVIGSDHDDTLRGTTRGSVLDGAGGDDTFEIGNDDAAVAGGAARSIVRGGEGLDTLTFENATAGITVDVVSTEDDPASTANSYSSIERVTGSGFDDSITTHARSEAIEGGAGADTLTGGDGDDLYIYNRGDGADVIQDYNDTEGATGELGDISSNMRIDDHHTRANGGLDALSLGEGFSYRHVFGGLAGGTDVTTIAAALGEDGPDITEHHAGAQDLSNVHFQLGFKTDAQLYESNLANLSDKITIKYGGIVNAGTVDVWHTYRVQHTRESPKTGDTSTYYTTHRAGVRLSFDEGAGDIERLGFEDSGYIEIGDINYFVNGTSVSDAALQANAGEATWLFAGEGDDTVTGSAEGDVLVGDLGDDLLQGGAGGDQYAYWTGDGHDIIEDADGKDALVFGGGLTRADVVVRYGVLTVAGDPSSFSELAKDDPGATALRLDVLELEPADPDNPAVTGSVTILNYAVPVAMIEEFRFADGEVLSLAALVGDLTATNYDDTLTGSGDADTISGGLGDDSLLGEGGDDVLNGGAGADTLDGGLGKDLVTYADSGAAVTVDLSLGQEPQVSTSGSGDEEGDVILNAEGVIGSDFADTLTGNAFGNEFIGGLGNDTLNGGDGDDVLEGSQGADAIDGGEGSDFARYQGSSAGVTVNLTAGTAAGGDAAGDTLTSIENVTGSELADTLTGDETDNILTGLGGADTLDGKLGNDTVSGGAGADTLRGDDGDDVLSGGDGNDTLWGGAGDDTLEGGAGADALQGEGDADTASYAGSDAAVTVSLTTNSGSGGHAQDDTLSGVENLTGSDHNDTLIGNTGANTLTGGAGNDTLEGKGGADTIDGGAGADTAIFSGSKAEFDVVRDGDDIIVTRIADTTDKDVVSNVETLSFADGDILIADLPDAAGGLVETPQGTEAIGKLAGIDGQTDVALLTFAAVGEAPGDTATTEHGQVQINADGSYTYTPNAGYTGTDKFSFRVTDADGYSDVAEVQITVYEDAWTAGAESQANTYTSSHQHDSTVAALAGGGHVVVWHSNGQDGSNYGIHGQRYDALGVAQGSEFLVNTHTSDHQQFPKVTGLNGGGFVVVWQSAGQDGSSWGIHGQRYNASGVAQGSEFQINTYTASHQHDPSVASLGDGGFVVVWHSNGQDGSNYSVHGQRYDASGVAQGPEFQVNTYTTNHQQYPQVVGLDGGGFVVVWQSNGQDGSSWGIHGQRYDAAGVAQGSEFQINTYTSSHQHDPSVASLGDGGFVVVWHSNGQDGSNYGIHGQRYNSAGVAQGAEFQVNTYTTNHQQYPQVVGLDNGGFFVVWQSNGQDGSGWGVYGQRYDATGTAIGGEVLINEHTSGNQYVATVAALEGGGIAVSWSTDSQDGSSWGVYQRVYLPTPRDLQGSAGNDVLHGGEGDDTLQGFAGADKLDGGAGTDTADYSASGSRVTVDLSATGENAAQSGDADGDSLANIENLVGSAHDDVLTGDGGTNVLSGAEGDDTLEGKAGADVLDGGGGSDAAVFDGLASDYELVRMGDEIIVTRVSDAADRDVLRNIETIRFTDGEVLLNDIPVADESLINVVRGTVVNGQLSGDDVQSGSAGLTYALEGGAANGTVSVNSNGNYTYTPNTGFAGSDKFSFRVTDTDGHSDVAEVQVTVYEDAWTAGVEAQVNTYTSSHQHDSAMAGLEGGGHVVVWHSYGQDGSLYGVYGQRYDASGVAQGAEFRVNTHTGDEQQYPRVTGLNGGGFVVVWQSYVQDGGGWGTYGQRYDVAGVAVGSEFQINTYTASHQLTPSVASLDDGGFVAVWHSYGQDGSLYGVYGQRYDASGIAQGAEFQVNTHTSNEQQYPQVTGLNGGRLRRGLAVIRSRWRRLGHLRSALQRFRRCSGVRVPDQHLYGKPPVCSYCGAA